MPVSFPSTIKAAVQAISNLSVKRNYLRSLKNALVDIADTMPSLKIAHASVTFASGVPTLDTDVQGITAAAMATNDLELTLPTDFTSLEQIHISAPDLDFRFQWRTSTIAAGKLPLELFTQTVATPPVASQVVAASIPNHRVSVLILYK